MSVDVTDPAVALLLSLVVDDKGTRWGERASDWQLADALAVLDRSSRRRFHYQTRPRGGSKTEDCAAVLLAILLEQAPPMARAYAYAADKRQSRLLLDSLEAMARRTPGILPRVEINAFDVSVRSTGATLEIAAADAAGTWGTRPFVVVCDERANWEATEQPEKLWRAAYSALPKVEGSRLLVLTSPSGPDHPAHGILTKARRSKMWRCSEVEGPLSWVSKEDLEEQKLMLPPWEFSRLVLGRWTSAADRVTTGADVDACMVRPAGDWLLRQPGERYLLTFDLAVVRDRAVCAVTHAAPRGEGQAPRVVLDRLEVWQPRKGERLSLAVIRDWMLAAHGDYGRPVFVGDNYQAESTLQDLARNHGVVYEQFKPTLESNGRIAVALFNALRQHALDLPDEEVVRSELLALRFKEPAPGRLKLEHSASGFNDISTCLAMAVEFWNRRSAEPDWSKMPPPMYVGGEW